jgi:hypothetical protein
VRRFLAVLILVVSSVAIASTGSASPAGPAPQAVATPLASLGIGHVWIIVLENESYKKAFVHNPHRYLGETLQQQGTVLTHYFGIGHYSLDNYLAMLSGQAPNPATSLDCQKFKKFKPTTHPVTINRHGQAVGVGCVYPPQVTTLADQLTAQGVTWGGYMEDMGAKRGREQPTCGVPHLSKHKFDDTQSATRKDQYAARHNPFVYFRSLTGSGLCASHVGNLDLLPTALADTASTPQFSFITPNLCDDGHDSPCRGTDAAGSRKGGLASVDHFLKVWVPAITQSPAYQQDGLLIITADESDSSAKSCCGERPGPKQKKPGRNGPGGGRIGALVIGKCVAAGAKDPTPYNHYALLRSLEDLFGVTTGGTDGLGHIGYAAAPDLQPFGSDLFGQC